jgi:hypothetical protein
MIRIKLGCISLVCLAAAAGLLMAQQPNGSITGTVQDSSGGATPVVTVTVRNVETGQTRTVLTDANGHYSAQSLPVGKYEIRAEKDGFAPAVRTGITLVVGQEAVVTMQLEVGGVQQTVTVDGEGPMVDATPASVAGVVNEKQIKDLPLNGRSWDTLITLNPSTANITSNQSTTSTGKGQGFNFSVSGNREDFNVFLMNGIEYTGVSTADVMPGGVSGLLLGVDAVREFNVLESAYGAEYGKRPGGQISVVTMSGTNQLHGSVFEFVRNSAFDARNFFSQSANPPFRRNQFGGALGGPVRRNKTFLFGNYEGFRQSLNLSDVTFVPDAGARNGTLLGTNGKPIGIAPGIAPYFALWPLANGPDLGGGVAIAYSNPLQTIREDFGNTRADQIFSASDILAAIYTIDDGRNLTPGANPLTKTLSVLRAQVASVQETHVFSPNFLNIARVGFSRAHWTLDASPQQTPPGTSFVAGAPTGDVSVGSASSNAVGAWSIAGSNGSQEYELVARNLFTYTDDVKITRRSHQIGAGIWFQRIQANDDAANQRYGLASFQSVTAFLQGQASQIVAVLNPAEIAWRQMAGAWYIEDAIKLRPNLTVSLGFRHEFNNGWNSPAGIASNYVFGSAGCAPGVTRCLQTAPTQGTSPFAQNNAKKLFAPRVGVAWAPFAKTAIHAAAGTFYNQLDYLGSCCDGSPIGTNLNINPSIGSKTAPVAFPILITAGLPDAKPSPAGVLPDLKMPTIEEWTFKIDQAITPNMLLSATYAGEHGFHLLDTVDANTVVPTAFANGSSAHPFPTTVVRANNAIANTRYTLSDANTSYSALQLNLTQRLAKGLQFRINYTFSKSLDTHSSSFLGNEGIAGTTTVMNPYNARSDWGPSNFNPARQLKGNFSYDLPFGHRQFFAANVSRLVDRVVSGWSWRGIITAQSGFPFTPLVGSNQSNNGDSRNPDRVSINPAFTGSVITGNPNQWFNPAAFLLPAAGTYGNAGRNILEGPGLVNLDTSLVKTTAIGENLKAELRAEFFNIINHANFGLPVVGMFASGLPSPTAGQITYTSTTGRQMQFGLKLLW